PCLEATVSNGTATCQGGTCTAGTPLDCDDLNLCTFDSCNPQTGCQHVAVPNGTSCQDATVCNGDEACSGGTCAPGTPMNCNDGNACTTDSCNALSGCIHTPIAGCQPCGVPADCNDTNPCTVDSCVGGQCQNTVAANGTSCSDGDGCNGLETCLNGACAAGTPISCEDGNPCTTDSCNGTGCVNTPVANGTACNNATVCD